MRKIRQPLHTQKSGNLSTHKIRQPLKKIRQPLQQKKHLSNFGKCNLTHLTNDMMFSGQRFAILAMFSSVWGRNRQNTTKYALKRPNLPLKRPKTYKNLYPYCLTPPLPLPLPTFRRFIIIKEIKLSTSADPPPLSTRC